MYHTNMDNVSKEQKEKRKALRELKEPCWVAAPIEATVKRRLVLYAALNGLTVERAIRQAIDEALERANLPSMD